jgi:hypothetical protein
MKWVNGDIWIYWKLGKIIVIPTTLVGRVMEVM